MQHAAFVVPHWLTFALVTAGLGLLLALMVGLTLWLSGRGDREGRRG